MGLIDESTEINLKLRCSGSDLRYFLAAVKFRMDSISNLSEEFIRLSRLYDQLHSLT